MAITYVSDFQGRTRNKPISDRLRAVLDYASRQAGVDVSIFSGGQEAKGEGRRRTGSVRHDHGNAADMRLSINGREIDFSDPAFSKFAAAAAAAGATGIGAGKGYMGENSIHVGFGTKGTWGAGGSSRNAPQWLKDAVQQGWGNSVDKSLLDRTKEIASTVGQGALFALTGGSRPQGDVGGEGPQIVSMPVSQVKSLQRALNAGGFTGANGKPLAVDGDIGPNTEHAIQGAAASASTVGASSPREQIKAVQASLNALGVGDENGDPLKTDGRFGPLTQSAIEKAAGFGVASTVDSVFGGPSISDMARGKTPDLSVAPQLNGGSPRSQATTAISTAAPRIPGSGVPSTSAGWTGTPDIQAPAIPQRSISDLARGRVTASQLDERGQSQVPGVLGPSSLKAAPIGYGTPTASVAATGALPEFRAPVTLSAVPNSYGNTGHEEASANKEIPTKVDPDEGFRDFYPPEKPRSTFTLKQLFKATPISYRAPEVQPPSQAVAQLQRVMAPTAQAPALTPQYPDQGFHNASPSAPVSITPKQVATQSFPGAPPLTAQSFRAAPKQLSMSDLARGKKPPATAPALGEQTIGELRQELMSMVKQVPKAMIDGAISFYTGSGPVKMAMDIGGHSPQAFWEAFSKNPGSPVYEAMAARAAAERFQRAGMAIAPQIGRDSYASYGSHGGNSGNYSSGGYRGSEGSRYQGPGSGGYTNRSGGN